MGLFTNNYNVGTDGAKKAALALQRNQTALKEAVEVLDTNKELVERNTEQLEYYRQQLRQCEMILVQYEKKLEHYDVSEEDKMAAVQMALDLTYIKEELDSVKNSQEEVTDYFNRTLERAICLLYEEGKKQNEIILDKVQQLKSDIPQLVKQNTEEITEEVVKRQTKGIRFGLVVSMILHVIAIAGIAVILYMVL